MTTAHFRDLLRTARQQIRLAIALYQGSAAVKQLANAVGANYRTYQMAYVEAAALIFPDHVHLTISGSDDRYDWLQNISASQVPHGEYTVHGGYSTATTLIANEMRRNGFCAFTSRKRLIIGGHSAGGAIAQLVAMEFGFQPNDVITFGSPRVFSPESAAEYGSNKSWDITQFAAGGDPVVRLPPRRFRWLFAKAQYASTVAPLLIEEDGRVVTDRDSSTIMQMVKIAASVLTRRWRAIHRATNYERLINGALARMGDDDAAKDVNNGVIG